MWLKLSSDIKCVHGIQNREKITVIKRKKRAQDKKKREEEKLPLPPGLSVKLCGSGEHLRT